MRLLVLLALATTTAAAQVRIGSVPTEDATVAGSFEVSGGRAILVGSSSVTARDRPAEVTLDRGGAVRICQTSGLHLTSGANALMLALDRGAIELKLTADPGDVILTPDLRFTLHAAGPLDLRLRVTASGDTCVEHRGTNAPTLTLTDTFGQATYELHAGQHVLFEHGNLREVVDHETSPCGCPPVQTVSLAQAAIGNRDEHPFPAAQSAGLAPDPEPTPSTPGVAHTQVSTSLTFESNPAPVPTPAPTPPAAPAPVPAPAKPEPHGFAHAVGHFFRRIFGSS